LGFLSDLQNEDQNLYKYVTAQIEKASLELDNIQEIFKEFTDHSSLHAKIVLEIGEKLNTVSLNIYEKAIYILSSYFHDIGMNIPQNKIYEYISKLDDNVNLDFYLNKIMTNEELVYDNISIQDKKYFIALNYFREKHNSLSAERISELYPENDKNSFINDKYLWNCVSEICLAHTLDISLLGQNPYFTGGCYIESGININILYLSILLRLADICHFSRDRAYPYIMKEKLFKSGKSKRIWEYYSNIITTTVEEESKVIRIQADCDNFIFHRAIINDIKKIQEELYKSHKLLLSNKSNYQLPWKYIDDSLVRPSLKSRYKFYDLKYNLNNNRIINLLLGERLYGNPLYSIRECIQNSIDAINVIKLKNQSKHYIYLKYYEEDEPILEIYDSGTGMNMYIIKSHFLSVGAKSYWMSEKGIEEWNINLNNFGLIADHGIGTLSYFMIAKQIEVYTKYLKSNDFIHIKIDDYNDNILCDNIDSKDFPVFTTLKDIKSPWDQGHGTCIKFVLKKELTFRKLITFLATNIIRCPIDLFFNYSREEYKLENIWHFNINNKNIKHGEYQEIYLEENNLDVQNNQEENIRLYKSLYDYPDDYFKRLPEKKLIKDYEISNDIFRGNIHINYLDAAIIEHRISQNGILIRNAREYLYNNMQYDLLLEAYGIDIEISGGKLFQLNAERTNIINSEYNQSLFFTIENILNKEYYKNISKIESTVYFECGKLFYHGIVDIIFDASNSVTYYHKNLSNVFFNENDNEYKQNSNYFNSAKLYMTGLEKCYPVSINDIKKENLVNLVLFKHQNTKFEEIYENAQENKIININDFKELILISISDKTIYIPEIFEPFMLPLYCNFNFKLKEENDYVYLIELSDGVLDIDDPLRIKLEELWDNNKY
jgi:hypothetical protein